MSTQRVLPEKDLEGRYKDLSAQRRFIQNDLLWNMLYRNAHPTALSDEHAEWVWWKERLIAAPTTQKLVNHVFAKVGTDRDCPMS